MDFKLPNVISVDEDWEALTDLPARATRFCPYYMVLVNTGDGRTVITGNLCRSWWHRSLESGPTDGLGGEAVQKRSAEQEAAPPSPYWKHVGGSSSRKVQVALRRSARRAKLHFAVTFEPPRILDTWSWSPPEGVPVEWWIETLTEELNREW